MKRLILFLLFSSLACAQGVRVDIPTIVNPLGKPIPNVNVQLCSGTATITGTSCSPQVQSFIDGTLATTCASGFPVTQPQIASCSATSDGAGNAGFWLSPASYIYCLTGPNVTGKCYNLTVPVGATPSGTLVTTNSVMIGGPSPWRSITAPAYG